MSLSASKKQLHRTFSRWYHKRQRRRRISFLPEFPGAQKRQEFSDKKLLGYSQKDVYMVVADINKYKDFLPWCKESLIIKHSDRHCVANLSVGFPPLVEKYTSFVTLRPDTFIRSVATNGRLFQHMETMWMFQSGPKHISEPSTLIYMKTIFEFRSMLYASLGTPIFSEVAKTLTQAFEARFQELYGPDHIKEHPLRHSMAQSVNTTRSD